MFLSSLQTEKDYDFLTIYDEVHEYYNPIKKLSGNLRSFGVSSSGNVMYVKFESDAWVNDIGFLATVNYGTKIKLPKYLIYQCIALVYYSLSLSLLRLRVFCFLAKTM